MESSCRGKRQKHSKTINDEESLQVNGKQGEEQNVDPMKKLRLLESLHTNDTKVTCCDFGPEREILFPDYFSAIRVKIGRTETEKIKGSSAK